jgi:hypothetical protein
MLAFAAASACASTPQNQQPAGSAATQSHQASSTALPQPSGTGRLIGKAQPVPGSFVSPQTPVTLPCGHGRVTLTLRGDGSDPDQICAHLGAQITLHLPALGIGPWQPPVLTGNRVVTLVSRQVASGITVRLTATATGTAQISSWANPSTAIGAPSHSWHATLTVIP